MSLSRRLRLLLPSRHRATAVAAATLLVLGAVGVQAACSVPANEHPGVVQAHSEHAHPPGGAEVQPADDVAPAPDHAAVRPARPAVHQDRRTPAGVAEAAAPSLHALGISRM